MSGFAASLIDQTLGGYTIKRMLARGGMGVVYEGVQESLRRRVAIKVMYPHLGDDESFRERFQREARAIAQLRHPNIVGVIDYGTEQGFQYMVMDLIDGLSLRDELSRRHQQGRPFSSDESLTILADIAAALSYAHRRGMIHRDVKPANVMLDTEGAIYLTDFGLVKLADTQNVTMTGMIVGTPEYMAPEQSIGLSDVTPAVDQYSLSVVAYQLLVGRVPFTAPTPVGVMQKHISEPPPPPHTIVPTFPADVERVLMRGLSKDPSDRYATIEAFLHELQRAVRSTSQGVPGMSARAREPERPIAVETTVVEIGGSTVVEPAEPTAGDASPLVTPMSSGSLGAPQVSSAVGDSAAGKAVSASESLARGPDLSGTPPPLSPLYAAPAALSGSSGGYQPPAMGWPVSGEFSGNSNSNSRSPLLAIAIALVLVLLVGSVAAAALVLTGGELKLGAADATSTPRRAARTPTAGSTAVVALLDATPTAVEVIATSTERPDATPTDGPASTPTEPAAATAQPIATATPSPIVIVVGPVTATPTSTAVSAEWNLLVDELFVDTTLFQTGEINGGATTGLVDGWYGITVPEGRWQTVSATWIEPVDDGAAYSYVGFLGTGKAGISALFRIEPDGTYSFVACWVSSDGAAGCDDVVHDVWTPIFRLPAGSIQMVEGNMLSLLIVDTWIIFSINSEEVAAGIPITPEYGHWGMFAQNDGGSLPAWFYYLAVYDIR